MPSPQVAHMEDEAKTDLNKSTTESVQSDKAKSYDVLISYSHRHREEPSQFYNILKEKYPHLNIFFDQSELKAGKQDSMNASIV